MFIRGWIAGAVVCSVFGIFTGWVQLSPFFFASNEKSHSDSTLTSSSQLRRGVLKTLWSLKKPCSLVAETASSELTFHLKKRGKVEVVEELTDLHLSTSSPMPAEIFAAHAIFSPSSNQVTGESVRGSFFVNGNLMYFEADQGSFEYTPDALERSVLEKNVRLFSILPSKIKRVATAETLCYEAKTDSILLCSSPPSRVLLWQTDGTISLSAPQIRIEIDPLTREESIQSVGHVHASLNLEETKTLEKIFSRFL